MGLDAHVTNHKKTRRNNAAKWQRSERVAVAELRAMALGLERLAKALGVSARGVTTAKLIDDCEANIRELRRLAARSAGNA